MLLKSWLCALVTIGAAQSALAAGNPLAGKSKFGACSMCHGMEGKGTPMAPPLKGVVGRKAGSVAGFAYSSAMRGSGIVWNDQRLSAFIAHPQAVVKGTRMAFPGKADPNDVADIVAYLDTLRTRD
jgi:cytochrome c